MPFRQSEMPGRLQAQLAKRGVRLTQQRRAILTVIETAKMHLDATRILRHARRLDSSVDRSTVYRTLNLLKRHGLVDELVLMHLEGEGHYYERKTGRDHIHMACNARKNILNCQMPCSTSQRATCFMLCQSEKNNNTVYRL